MLVLRALGVGDLLTGVPAYRALRRAFPSYELVLAAPAELEPLAELTGSIDRLLPARALEPIPWRDAAPPRVAVNLHGRGPESHRLLDALHPERLIAFACVGPGTAGPEWRADEHEVRRWCRLLRESAIPADPGELDIARPLVDAPVPGAVAVHPGAASASRRWPPDRFAAVARALTRARYRVVLTGSPAERSLALGVASDAGIPARDVLAGRTDMDQLAAQVAEASLVISGDTGVAHLATAYRRPSVVLFGPLPPRLWGPPARPYHLPLWRGSGLGDPHGEPIDPALLRLSVPEVLDACHDVLASAPHPQPTTI